MAQRFNPEIHHRRSIRLKRYDYAQQGLYFITICVKNRLLLFGNISDGKMELNNAGQMVYKWWHELMNKFQNIELHESIIMPNHFHGIIQIIPVGADLRVCPENTVQPHNVGQSHRIAPTDTTGQSHDSGQSHRVAPTDTMGQSHDSGQSHRIAPTDTTGQSHDSGQSHRNAPTDTTGQSHDSGQSHRNAPTDTTGQSHDSGQSHRNAPTDTTGQSHDSGQSHRIAPTDTTGQSHDSGQSHRIAPTDGIANTGLLPKMVQWFKTMTTNEYIRNVKQNNWPPFNGKLWQRNYFEHIIRNEKSYYQIVEYIINNPLKWQDDRYYDK